MISIYTLAWVPMVFIAIANGILRDQGYKRYMTELRAHQLSTLIGAIVFAIYTWILVRWGPLESDGQSFVIGSIWLLLTVVFELCFGLFVVKFMWRRLAADYNILKGRVWSLLLIWLFVLPYVVHRLQA